MNFKVCRIQTWAFRLPSVGLNHHAITANLIEVHHTKPTHKSCVLKLHVPVHVRVPVRVPVHLGVCVRVRVRIRIRIHEHEHEHVHYQGHEREHKCEHGHGHGHGQGQGHGHRQISRLYNAGMSDCLASSQSGTSMKKLTMPELVQYRTKLMQSGIFLVRYQTE